MYKPACRHVWSHLNSIHSYFSGMKSKFHFIEDCSLLLYCLHIKLPVGIDGVIIYFVVHHVLLCSKWENICNLSYYFWIYRVSQVECARLREGVPYVKVYRYNPKHICPKLNGYGDNGQWSLKLWQLLRTYWLPNTY